MNPLSNKRNRMIFVFGIVLFLIFGLFVWRWRSRSTYATADMATAAAGTTTANYYSNLQTCQSAFATTTLGQVGVHQSISCTGTTVTASTIVPHGYTTNQVINVQGVSSDGTTGAVTGYNGSGITVTAGPYNNNVFQYQYTSPVTCGGTPSVYGYSWLSTATAVNTANVTRVQCISSNVQMYMNAVCPWTVTTASGLNIPADNTTGTILAPGSSPSASSNILFQTYQTNITNIKNAYSLLMIQAQGGVISSPTQQQIQAARTADFTSATRAYFQSICPGFYKIALMDPGANQITKGTTYPYTIPQSPYSTYNTVGTTQASGSWFNPANITAANVLNWVTKSTTTTALTNTYPPGSTIANVAADLGPGTVTASGSFGTTMTIT